MRLIVLAVTVFTLSSGCSVVRDSVQRAPESVTPEPVTCNNKKYSQSDLHLAALEVIYPRVIHDPSTLAQITDARSRLAKLRTWAITVQPVNIRAEYISWIDFYAGRYADAEARLAAKVETADKQREREREEESSRARALALCLPKP